MKKLVNKKRKLDKHIEQHKDEIVEFSLVSDDLGVLDIKTTAGELFDNMSLVYMSDAVKQYMKIGKVYEYAASQFKGDCMPVPQLMFRAGIDPAASDLFQTDPTVEYEHDQIYAFPLEFITEHIQKRPVVHTTSVASWEAPSDFDMEQLKDFLESAPTPDEVESYLYSNGFTKLED